MSGNKPNRIAGTLTLTVDGVTMACAGDFTWNPGTPERTALIGSDGKVHGYSETAKAPFIEGDLRITKGFDIKEFCDKDGVDAQLTLATGDTWVYSDGWVAGTADAGTAEGTLPFRFEAKASEKV